MSLQYMPCVLENTQSQMRQFTIYVDNRECTLLIFNILRLRFCIDKRIQAM